MTIARAPAFRRFEAQSFSALTLNCLSLESSLSQLAVLLINSVQISARPARSLSQGAAPLCAPAKLIRHAPMQLSANQNKQIVFSKPAEELSDTSFALPSNSGINFLLKTIDSLNGLVLVHFCRKARF